MRAQSTIPDGVYLLTPDEGEQQAVIFRAGAVLYTIHERQHAAYVAAGHTSDLFAAWIEIECVAPDVAARIVAICFKRTKLPENVRVMRETGGDYADESYVCDVCDKVVCATVHIDFVNGLGGGDICGSCLDRLRLQADK